MAEHRVVGVEIERAAGPLADPHPDLLCLEDGRRIPLPRAISNIRYGVEAYYTEVAGVQARLRVVDPCSRCGEAYLRADADATLPDHLMTLPPCPPLEGTPAKPRRGGTDRGGRPPPTRT